MNRINLRFIKKLIDWYIQPAFVIHKSDTFLHAQATIIGQAGAKLAISHVEKFMQIQIAQEVLIL
jgi:hypothetical protein